MTSVDNKVFKTNKSGFKRDIEPPRTAVPPGTCDTHMHIVGPFRNYPLREVSSLQPPESTLQDYLNVMQITGIERCVIVQPSFFAKDNACTLDSVKALGDKARGIVVIDPDIGDAALQEMHDQGARGIRIQRVVAGGASLTDIEELAARIAPFGWHIQLYIDSQDLVELTPIIKRLPVDVVFDHMAHVGRDSRIDHAGFKSLLDLLETEKAWVKLSNARFSPDPERARLLVAANSERVVWGSDWPHVSYEETVIGEGQLLDMFAEWIPNDKIRHDILVTNPERLYFK